MDKSPSAVTPERFASGMTFEHIGIRQPGETAEQARERDAREFLALQQSPVFRIWACAAIDEMLSALYERLTVGSRGQA
jgi:hypothetical protein